MKTIPGYIQWAYSSRAKREFPVLVFSADVDFVTEGMVSLTSTDRREVVATMATGREWEHFDLKHVQRRVNRELERSDLRCVEFVREEESRLIYADLYDKRRRAFATRTQSLSAFCKSGGIITRHQFDG